MGRLHIPAVILAGLATVMFIAAVRMRLFGRVRHGFLILLVVAMAGASLVTASLLGLWGFVQGERILFREFVDQMQTLGTVVAEEVRSDLAETSRGLERLALEISPEMARQNPTKVRETIAAVQAFDRHLLQVSIVDERATLVFSVTTQGEPEAISRVGVAFSLEGKPFVSEAYLSPTFKRWVVALGVPVKGADGAVRGVVTARYDVQGVLDKFIGDGMLAVFGSLDEAPDHARRAVHAALRMKVLLAKLNGERAVAGRAPIGIGIAIHTDEVIVGNIGSRRRLEYTVIGDGVNTCSRVEALNKEFGTTILITEATHAEAGDEFECRLMPETALRGKAKALRVYEVVSRKLAPAAAPD